MTLVKLNCQKLTLCKGKKQKCEGGTGGLKRGLVGVAWSKKPSYWLRNGVLLEVKVRFTEGKIWAFSKKKGGKQGVKMALENG